MLVYKSIIIIASILLLCVSVWGIAEAVLHYKKKMKELDEKYNIKIICK